MNKTTHFPLLLAGVVVAMTANPGWAGSPPNPTPSDSTNSTAAGTVVLINNEGDNNTGFGGEALRSNTTGIKNTASGASALFWNTTG